MRLNVYKMKNIILTSLFCVCACTLLSQVPATGEAKLLYRKEAVGGLIIHTSGWGGHFRYGKQITNLKKLSFGFDLVNLRHPKEKKVFNPGFDDGKGYYYGKINSLIAFRPTIGMRSILFPKMRKQGVEIGYNVGIGPTIGFAKPVYLEIVTITSEGFIISEEKFDPARHTVDNIYGRARFSKGINELKIYPGAFAKFGLHFEYSDEEDRIKALEVGAIADYFPKAVPVMAIADNKNLYLNLYIAIIFGRKYF